MSEVKVDKISGKTSANADAQFASGKLLIRVTGFKAFDDV